MRYFLFILLAGLLSACSSDDESNAAATAAKLEVSKNEVKRNGYHCMDCRSDLDRRLVEYIKELRGGKW